jgi:hypothetical protein
MLGFKQVGIRSPSTVKMRFYSGDHDGQMNHHDIAPCENPNRPRCRAIEGVSAFRRRLAHKKARFSPSAGWDSLTEWVQCAILQTFPPSPRNGEVRPRVAIQPTAIERPNLLRVSDAGPQHGRIGHDGPASETLNITRRRL